MIDKANELINVVCDYLIEDIKGGEKASDRPYKAAIEFLKMNDIKFGIRPDGKSYNSEINDLCSAVEIDIMDEHIGLPS